MILMYIINLGSEGSLRLDKKTGSKARIMGVLPSVLLFYPHLESPQLRQVRQPSILIMALVLHLMHS